MTEPNRSLTPTPRQDLLLRAMLSDDLPALFELSDAQRWSQRLADWQQLYKMGEGLVVEIDGALQACAMRCRWSAERASIGQLMIRDGGDVAQLGLPLLSALLQGLDGVGVDMLIHGDGVQLGERLGFLPDGAVRQWQGVARSTLPLALPPGRRLRPAGGHEAAALRMLESAAHGVHRAALLAGLLEGASRCVVLDQDGAAIGFAVARRYGRGQRIGPVVAPDAVGAQALIGHLIGLQAGHFTRIDMAPATEGLDAWLAETGLQPTRQRQRMRRGPAPVPAARAQTFAVTDPAFG